MEATLYLCWIDQGGLQACNICWLCDQLHKEHRKMCYLWWFVILFRIQTLEEGTGCVISQIVHVAFIPFLFACWLFRCSSAVYPIVVIGTKSLKLLFHLHCSFCLLLWLCGAGASRISFLVRSPDVNWGASLSVTSGTWCECMHNLRSLSHARFSVSAEHMRVFLCSSQIQKRWVSETHFPNAGNFTKTLPVLYPASALRHNQRGLCWGAQGGMIMLMLSCSWYPPLRVLKPFCSVPGLQNSVWEPGSILQHLTFQHIEPSACRWIKGIT